MFEKMLVSQTDSGLGTLREGCKQKEPLWIVFEVSRTINLLSYLTVSSYKTIDGREHQQQIDGPRFDSQLVSEFLYH